MSAFSFFFFFFFSSRRRHTRWNCDWSSDVCSSDLALTTGGRLRAQVSVHGRPALGAICELDALVPRSPASKELYQKLWEGNVDAQGICRSSRQAAGVYKLRVSL